MRTGRLYAVLGAVCAMLALAAPVAAAAGGSQISGRTAQHYRIRFERQGTALDLQRFTIRLKCRDGSVLIDEESGFQATPVRHGSFSDRQLGSTDVVQLRGHLGAKGLKGRVRVRDKLSSGVRCDSRWVAFTAR
jgi:hypothetical protein